ncbi:MAG TPA: ADOP family duplicated permease [Bryobacteraceae bacterium]|jgi:predicted permease
MSVWSKIANVFRSSERRNAELDEEAESHIDEAIARGRSSSEARRAFGSPLLMRERSGDLRVVVWLDSLRADAIFGWRQLLKTKVTTAAAIMTLALALGSCASAFRLIDALLLRPLPIKNSGSLYSVIRQMDFGAVDGKTHYSDGWTYPLYQRMRANVADHAQVIATATDISDLTYTSAQESEKARVQYVSGSLFHAFRLKPAAGRLLDESDDREQSARPVAVLSYAYWSSRFDRNPSVVGRSFRLGNRIYEIIGVCEPPFTGTEPGFVSGIFVPISMHAGVNRTDSTWLEMFALLQPGIAPEPAREKLNAMSLAFEQERAKAFLGMSKQSIDAYLRQNLLLEPATAGRSVLQTMYRSSLMTLAVLVALVLLIACVNVANLMTAQAAARGREMALRVSIGAGRWRLVQLVLVQSAWLATLAGLLAAFFSWWSAPLVVRMISSRDANVQLDLGADWRVLGFGIVLILAVTLLFGLAPALTASGIKPASSLKGGETPNSKRRLMYGLIAAQVMFCILVLFVGSLFVATFDRLIHQYTGFSTDRLLVANLVTGQPEPDIYWSEVAEHVRNLPGIEAAALSSRPLLSGYSSNDAIAINGGPPSQEMAFFLNISPGFLGALRIPLIAGRDFRAGDAYPGTAIVSEAFVRKYFPNQSPVGKMFERADDDGSRLRLEIVGVTRDARYLGMREPIVPVVYIPFHRAAIQGAAQPITRGTLIVETSSADPLALAALLRQEVPKARPDFRVTRVETQLEINQTHTMRERVLATLALFFAMVALLLAAIGLYGVLDYSVLQRRREIGIRMAIGAPATNIARLVTMDALAAVTAGAAAGLAVGLASVRYVASLIYEVKATDPLMLAIPSLTILAAALLAALPAVIRAIRLDPVDMLRSE